MSSENQWLEDVFPTEIVLFRGHVSFPGVYQIVPSARFGFANVPAEDGR